MSCCAGQEKKKDLEGAGVSWAAQVVEKRWRGRKTVACAVDVRLLPSQPLISKLTWLVLGGDPAARSHRVEQFTAL